MSMKSLNPLWSMLNSSILERMEQIKNGNTRFVHYTSAENGLNILDSGEIWLRNVQSMNDYTEVEHGIKLLAEALNETTGVLKDFWPRLEALRPGISQLVMGFVEENVFGAKFNTYAFCLSEHCSDEDATGRLSMWRAYGKSPAGVAIVLNNKPFLSATEFSEVGIFSIPIEYQTSEHFIADIRNLISKIEANPHLFGDLDDGSAGWSIAFALILRALGCKHPGFHEELEWRVVHNRQFFPRSILQPHIVSIGGIPQVVQRLRIRDYSEFEIHGSQIDEVIDRVIIGPTEYGSLIYDAFVRKLGAMGVENPEKKVVLSNVPLR